MSKVDGLPTSKPASIVLKQIFGVIFQGCITVASPKMIARAGIGLTSGDGFGALNWRHGGGSVIGLTGPDYCLEQLDPLHGSSGFVQPHGATESQS